MELPKLYTTINQSQRRDFQDTLAKFSSCLTWGEEECDVLDVGCGSGDVTRDVLRPSLQCSKPRIVGIDVSQAMVDFARTSRTHELQFHVMDIATSQNPRHLFPDGFDKIYSNCVLHWVSNERHAMQNMYDLLKPGGEMVLLFMAWHPGIHAVEILATKPMWEAYSLQDTLKHVFPHRHSEDPAKEVRELLESLGFHVESCECYERSFSFENRQAILGKTHFLS
ncbi:hypothetical protein B566_EDAN015372 [Ephemera danica]|nr:hypothetical protein B566_EDAN015372 [Ephemera danica]